MICPTIFETPGRVCLVGYVFWQYPGAYSSMAKTSRFGARALQSTYFEVQWWSLSNAGIVCARQQYRLHSGNRHYSGHCHTGSSPSVPRDFTGAIAGNRHYSTGTIEGLLHPTINNDSLLTRLVWVCTWCKTTKTMVYLSCDIGCMRNRR